MRLNPTTNRLRALLIAALACCAFAAITSAQTPDGQRPNNNQVVRSGPPSCSEADKVEVSEFSLNPQQPTVGQSATIRMTIKSKCPSNTRPVDLQWDINGGSPSQKLAGGNTQLNAGASSTFTAMWTASAGTHNLWGGVSNNLSESAGANRENNTRELDVTIQPTLVEIMLNHVKAKESGANFTVTRDGPTPCFITGNGGHAAPSYGGPEITEFNINCDNWQLGGKGIYEAYSGFTLKNGWRIKSYEVEKKYGENSRKGWSWLSSSPAVGGTNPYFKVRVWADADEIMKIGVKIKIEGPEGTNPYQ